MLACGRWATCGCCIWYTHWLHNFLIHSFFIFDSIPFVCGNIWTTKKITIWRGSFGCNVRFETFHLSAWTTLIFLFRVFMHKKKHSRPGWHSEWNYVCPRNLQKDRKNLNCTWKKFHSKIQWYAPDSIILDTDFDHICRNPLEKISKSKPLIHWPMERWRETVECWRHVR